MIPVANSLEGLEEKGLSLKDLSHMVELDDISRSKGVILIVGPCRCGSTAVLKEFACGNFISYFQPFKRLLRNSMVSSASTLIISGQGDRPTVIKETLGPFSMKEAQLDPLRVLMDLGLPATSIRLITMFRDPFQMYASWYRSFIRPPWFLDVNLEVFSASIQQLLDIDHRGREIGCKTVSFAPDGIVGFTGSDVLRRLFAALDLEGRDSIGEWRGFPKFSEPGSNIVRDVEPGVFRSPGIMDKVKNSDAFHVVTKPRADLSISVERRKVLEHWVPYYDWFVRKSLQDLRI